MFRLIVRQIVFLTIVIMAVALPRSFAEDKPGEFRIRNATTAIKIAKVALEQEFGKEELKRMKYFEASLSGDNWEVHAHPYKRGQMPPSYGGTWDFVIAVKGGCVVQISIEM
ncbi:MAG TPA: NTF2 fold immunity protein [Terriglobales bacterium]|nr:NTF2 fold immunity protein [Terriglobales bacterium]